MTDPRPAPQQRKAAGTETVAALRLQLADRDRRLAELTEHSLQILDKLTTAREELRDRDRLRAHVDKLQELLADTRRRIRAAGRAVLGPEPLPQQQWQVVVWGVTAAHTRAVDELLAALPHAPVTLLLAPGTAPAPFARAHGGGLGVLEPGCRAPAEAWNQAVASTQTEVVVVLGAGAVPAPGAIEQLVVAAAAEDVVAVSPCLRRGETRTLGQEDRGLLDLGDRDAGDATDVVPVPFASPAAFALARRTFGEIGPFDQDLHGDLALAEWCLRGAQRGLRCLGVAAAEVALPAAAAAGDTGDAAAAAADRMVVLARHEPERLAAAALATPQFWQGDQNAIAATLAAVFRRLPQARELPGAVELLVAQTMAVAAAVRELPGLHASVTELAGVLGMARDGEPGLLQLVERMRAVATELRERSQAVPELRADLQRHAAAIREQKDEMLARAGTIDALKDEMVARERAIMSLRQELVHRHAEIDQLRQEIENTGTLRAEVERLTQRAGASSERAEQFARMQAEIAQNAVAIAQRQLEAAQLQALLDGQRQQLAALAAERDAVAAERETLRGEGGQLRAEVAALRAEVAELQMRHREQQDLAQRLLEQVGQRVGETRELAAARDATAQELEAARDAAAQQLAATREAATQQLAATRDAATQELEATRDAAARELAAARAAASARLRELERALGDEAERLQQLLGELETVRTGHESLRREHGSLQEQRIELESRTHELVTILRDRERWIVALLQEIARRRLRPWPRPLSAHERDFLARHGARERP